jgi:hypothetical protein
MGESWFRISLPHDNAIWRLNASPFSMLGRLSYGDEVKDG